MQESVNLRREGDSVLNDYSLNPASTDLMYPRYSLWSDFKKKRKLRYAQEEFNTIFHLAQLQVTFCEEFHIFFFSFSHFAIFLIFPFSKFILHLWNLWLKNLPPGCPGNRIWFHRVELQSSITALFNQTQGCIKFPTTWYSSSPLNFKSWFFPI